MAEARPIPGSTLVAGPTDPGHEVPPRSVPYEVVAWLSHFRYPACGDYKIPASAESCTDSVHCFVPPAQLAARREVSHLANP